jgi:hypothetical protein
MVVVPATSTSATTEIAKVSFTVPPFGMVRKRNELARWKLQKGGKVYVRLGLTLFFPPRNWSIGHLHAALNLNLIAALSWL